MVTKVHGRRARFWLTDIAGDEKDLSRYLNSVDFGDSVDFDDVTAFNGDGGHETVTGLHGITCRISGQYSQDDDGPEDILYTLLGGGAAGTALTVFKYAPRGSTTGYRTIIGTAFVASFAGPSASLSSHIPFQADFSVQGLPSRGTFAP